MRIAFIIAAALFPAMVQASTYMRVDVTGTVDSISTSYSGSVDVAVGDPFSVTGYFDLSVAPRPTSTAQNVQYRNIGVAMFANVGGYNIVHGTPVPPVPASLSSTYADAQLLDYDPPSYSGVNFRFSATSPDLLNGFSLYYVSVRAQDWDSVGFSDMTFNADKFTAATLAEMESLHRGFLSNQGVASPSF